MSTNAAAAERLSTIATLLEILGEDKFRVFAHQKAARAVEAMTQDLTTLAQSKWGGAELLKIDGIGPKTADKLIEFVTTGTMAELEELKADYRSLVDELPNEVRQLFMFSAPASNGSTIGGSPKSASNGKRSRMTASQVEELRGEILTQLKANNEPMGRKDFDMGDYNPAQWMIQVAKLKSEGKVKQTGEKAGAVYSLAKK